MKYFQLDFHISPYREMIADILENMLGACGFEAFVPTADGFVGYVPQNAYNKEEVIRIVKDFRHSYDIQYQVADAPDEDWNQQWEEEGFEPVAMDDLVCIHDERHKDVPPCKYDIIINPKMAFGTGSHATTRMILRHLCQMPMNGLKVIDAGCGTGVLGILASMCGANNVFAYDIDPWSVENTITNAKLNGIDNISVLEGDASILPQNQTYGLLIANINRNILLADMPRFAQALAKGGRLILSGFLIDDIALLSDRGKEFGLKINRKKQDDEWAMLEMVRE